MEKINLLKSSLIALSLGLFVTSCGSDGNTDLIETNPDEIGSNTATIRLTEGGASDDIFFAQANGEAGKKVKGRVVFNSDKLMRRLYVTETMPGGTPEIFVIPGLDKKGTKGDGSIDLDKDRADDTDNRKSFDFSFDLAVPDNMDGEIQYSFWATTGKGDYRNPTKRQLVGVGTIIVKVGNGDVTDKVLSFDDVKLFAPDSEGKTETFFSIFNGQANRIDKGPEYRAFWDFGYYYTNSEGASLVSANQYEVAFPFPVKGLKPEITEEDAANETLNNAFFRKSTLTSAQFDAVTISDLAAINPPTIAKVNGLTATDIVEFIDNYGNKGLIRIDQVEGTTGNLDFMQIDVKIQPNSIIIQKN